MKRAYCVTKRAICSPVCSLVLQSEMTAWRKRHPNFYIKLFTVKSACHLFREITYVTCNAVFQGRSCSWEQRARIGSYVRHLRCAHGNCLWNDDTNSEICQCVASINGLQAISVLFENILGSLIKRMDEFSTKCRNCRRNFRFDTAFYSCTANIQN